MKRLALAVVLAFTLTLGVGLLTPPQQAHASPTVTATAQPPRWHALKWAEGEAGCWYDYGGESCSPGFDCSGLVQRAYAAVGFTIPRTTEEMIASPRLRRIPIADAKQGDLLFYGTGHVELKTAHYHVSFGAQQTGTRVGWHPWGGSWAPTMAFRVNGAGI